MAELSCYHLIHTPGPPVRVLLAAKNISGRRRDWQPVPTMIWNNAGQVAIPGGRQNPRESRLLAAQREFLEETGVDVRDAEVRARMHCVGAPYEHTFNEGIKDDEFSCTYQEVGALEPVLGWVNANIGLGATATDELHAAGWSTLAEARAAFGPRPLTGWRQTQYMALTPAQRLIADRKMNGPFEWFRQAIYPLVDATAPASIETLKGGVA